MVFVEANGSLNIGMFELATSTLIQGMVKVDGQWQEAGDRRQEAGGRR